MNYYGIYTKHENFECVNRHNKAAAIREGRIYAASYWIGKEVKVYCQEGSTGACANYIACFVRRYKKDGSGSTYVERIY